MSPYDDKLQKSKSIDGCLKYFFRKKLYVKKQFENFYVCMHHDPVYCLLLEQTMMQQHVLFQGGVAKLAEQL